MAGNIGLGECLPGMHEFGLQHLLSHVVVHAYYSSSSEVFKVIFPYKVYQKAAWATWVPPLFFLKWKQQRKICLLRIKDSFTSLWDSILNNTRLEMNAICWGIAGKQLTQSALLYNIVPVRVVCQDALNTILASDFVTLWSIFPSFHLVILRSIMEWTCCTSNDVFVTVSLLCYLHSDGLICLSKDAFCVRYAWHTQEW